MAVYRDRIKRNDTALVASVNDAIVGIDWITGTGGYEEDIALSVSLSPGSCLGHDLNEHPDYRGKGVGMALLSQSLIHSCNTGYKRQLTIVHSANTKMLSAAVTIFGFTTIGEITTTRIFHRKSSRWKLGSNHGRDAVVL
jgi:GNAT superfamily N-acetyltransferase